MHYFVNHTRFHVIELGVGPLTLVFLHYFGGSALEWQQVMDQLAGQYHCIAIDLRGHGDSEAPVRGYSVETMADDVLALMQKLRIQDYVVVGHSLSGKVALALASRQPTGLRSLVLISPSPPLPEPITDTDRQDMLETHGQRSAAEKTFVNITAKALSEIAREQIIVDNLRTSEIAWKAWLTLGSQEDISTQMANIHIPVAVLVGTQDKAIPPDVQLTRTLPYLKSATFDTIDATGHLLPWETPNELAAFIQKKAATQ